MNTRSTETVVNPNEVTVVSSTGTPVTEAHIVNIPVEDRPVEIDEDGGDEENSIASLYACNYCHSFGMEGCPCGRCGEDAGSYYVGEKMTEEKMEEAVRLMREEDEHVPSEDESEEED